MLGSERDHERTRDTHHGSDQRRLPREEIKFLNERGEIGSQELRRILEAHPKHPILVSSSGFAGNIDQAVDLQDTEHTDFMPVIYLINVDLSGNAERIKTGAIAGLVTTHPTPRIFDPKLLRGEDDVVFSRFFIFARKNNLAQLKKEFPSLFGG